MVGLLKEYICTDPGIFKPFIVLYRGCSDIDIYTADGSIFMLDAVDRINTFKDILDGIVYRVLPGFNGKALVSHILKGDNLPADFLLSHFLSGDVLVLSVVRTVYAPIYAIVGQIQGRKQDNGYHRYLS